MRTKPEYIFFTVLLGILPLAMQAQTLEDAREWYLEGRYAEALPVFEREYRNDPDNAPVNQWLGVSLYETGRIIEAEQYLSFAAEKKIPEAYLYLGELYAKLYRFDEAEAQFEKYQRVNRRDKEALDKLAERREYAAKLQRAINRTEDIQIIDSLVLPKDALLSAYNLSKSSGSLQSVTDFFKNLPLASDQTLYMNERGDKIYYSLENPVTGSDLFTMDKLIDHFGNEKKLPPPVNEDGDQAYPFVMNDGITLYFASTGHASLGGYDLYVTRYNSSADSYLVPNQLNMPFNSPFNDYLMAIDEEKGVGWFATDRFMPADSVLVYTFIPNLQVTLLETDDPKEKANRARITSIKDTWRSGTNYDALRERARQKRTDRQKSADDFDFVINDEATYHSLSDFRSSTATQIFSQALGLEKQLQALQEDLSKKREQYANGEESETLRASILSMEKEVYDLFRKIERLKVQARNEENRALQ